MSTVQTNEALQQLRNQVISAGVSSVTPVHVESARGAFDTTLTAGAGGAGSRIPPGVPGVAARTVRAERVGREVFMIPLNPDL